MRSCVRAVVHHLRSDGSPVAYRDVEESCGRPIREIVQEPRADAVKEWTVGLHRALQELDQQAKFRLISCHLTLYNKRTSVFFSPSDGKEFRAADQAPKRVVLLIDDIFDMYTRLSAEGEVFDEEAESERVMGRLRDALAESLGEGDAPRGLSEVEQALSQLDARVGILQRIIGWRRSEMIVAENLALQLGVPLTLLGLKHPMSVMRLLLDLDHEPCVTYISHPISRLRVEQRRTGQWDGYCAKLNQIPGRLANHGVVGIMPTAIDEMRFVAPERDHAFRRRGGLSTRWPLVESESGLVGSDFAEGVADLVVPPAVLNDAPAEGSIYLRALETTISSEVPFRDHFLVTHCQHFMAFRPREQAQDFSRRCPCRDRPFSTVD